MYVRLIFVFLLFAWTGLVHSQDCTLNIGGVDTGIVEQLFQLNGEQIAFMENLQADFRVKQKSMEEDIEVLFNTHPQGSPEELEKLAEKYRLLQQRMVKASKDCDTKFLSVLNQRQYQRYLELCYEVIRKPIRVVPAPMKTRGGKKE